MKDDWQALVRASSGYLELGMLKEAARALQKIAPEDRMRSAVLGVQVGLYIKQGNWNSAEACWPPREARTGRRGLVDSLRLLDEVRPDD